MKLYSSGVQSGHGRVLRYGIIREPYGCKDKICSTTDQESKGMSLIL